MVPTRLSRRSVLQILGLAALGSGAGCLAQSQNQSPAGEENTSSTTTTATSTTITTTTTTEGPQKGDNLLSVSRVDNSTAMQANKSKRASFSEFNESQQEVFLKAYNCSCNVNQVVFTFNDKDRVEYVQYDGDWYFLRVTIV